ncbi:MAG: tRNA (adenosine(37)-N6)-threonylcarbamoyltransferase complex transferase subunit TsaD [Bacteroidales bacterium]|nr:MAG: tRNA (adenosine(37)-N6)-threonylcarbamoyltransferase complex transferase subunit TsaD [Bacteroidales bacterium]
MITTILGIETSCDDTAAAIVENGYIISNIIADQEVHKSYGGVIPELASRAHQQNIIPVVEQALAESGKTRKDINAVAFTRGPGLIGALLVGTSFAKGLSLALNIPLIEVNHLQAHILSNFIIKKSEKRNLPEFPFLCLLVSGGHTQLVIVRDYLKMEIIGQTLDDAAGEAFDKCAKVLGLPYPGGPFIDKYAKKGNPHTYSFSKPDIKDYDFSFSGLKTAFLYFIRDKIKDDKNFITSNLSNICASIQNSIIEILLDKLIKASIEKGLNEIAVAGGVSANSELRKRFISEGKKRNWNVYIPEFEYSTDNAAMIAITGYYKYLSSQFSNHYITPVARLKI